MKTFLFTLLLTLFGVLQGQAQTAEFAPLGARWIREAYVSVTNQIQMSSVVIGDTILQGITCRVIQVGSTVINLESNESSYYNIHREYVYTQGDKVYSYRNNSFYVLYDFGAQVGTTWEIVANAGGSTFETGSVMVDSIGIETINGMALRYLWVHSPAESCAGFFYEPVKIIERIGTTHYGTTFPDWLVNDCLWIGADYSNGSLKCYEDAVMFYGEGDSCFLSVGTAVPASPLPGQGSYTLYPNPASNYIQLHADFLPPYQPVDFALYDINGRLQYQKTLPNASAPRHTDISHLPEGLYVYEFSQNRQVLGSGKLLKLPSR